MGHRDTSAPFRGRRTHQRIEIHGPLQGGSTRHDFRVLKTRGEEGRMGGGGNETEH